MDHLTDGQLQDIIDGNVSRSDPLYGHLDGCGRCRQALADYQVIYAGLNEDIPIDLSADFADKVVAEVSPAPVNFWSRFVIRDRMVAFVAFAAMLATAIYFIKPAVLAKAFGGFNPPTAPPDSQLLATISERLSALNINPVMLVMIALTVIAIGLLDQIISRHRKRRGPVSFLV